jgi:hypothetical protein
MVQNASVLTVAPFRQQGPFSIQPRDENTEKGPASAPKYLQMRGQLGRTNHFKPTWKQVDWVFAPTYSILGLDIVALIGPSPSGVCPNFACDIGGMACFHWGIQGSWASLTSKEGWRCYLLLLGLLWTWFSEMATAWRLHRPAWPQRTLALSCEWVRACRGATSSKALVALVLVGLASQLQLLYWINTKHRCWGPDWNL